MSDYTFAQLRLQFIELADLQPGLTDRAFRLVLHLIVRHLNRTDGTCSIDDTSLARELGCSTDTISRAVACAERPGLLMIKRGRWLRPTHYSMSAQAWQAAERRRRITGKSAEQGTPQICGGYPAKQPSNTPQKSGAFYRSEIKEKSTGADTTPTAVLALPDAGLSGTAQVPEAIGPAFVALKSFPMKVWNERLEDFGLPRIERWMPQGVVAGKAGFLLPALWPANKDSPLWQEQLDCLGNQYRESQRNAEDCHVL